MKNLLVDLGSFVPGAAACGIRSLNNKRAQRHAGLQDERLLRYFLIYMLSIFTVCFKVAVYN